MVRLVDSRGAHLKVAASSVTRGRMAEGGNLSDITQSGHSPRAADVADGALAPTAGAEKSRGRPQSQGQFWLGRRIAVRASWSEGSASQGSDTLDTGHCPSHTCRTRREGWQGLHRGSEKPTCSLVACGQQHPA